MLVYACTFCYGCKIVISTCVITGVALIGNAIIASDNILPNDFLSAAATTNTDTILARCVTGLGPSGSQDNTVLGRWTFNGSAIPHGECTDGLVIQPRGDSNIAGVIDLYQCQAFTTTSEGIYTCTIMNSSMMDQSMSVGVYFTGRSK